jgi:large subunit ribosomal protein L31
VQAKITQTLALSQTACYNSLAMKNTIHPKYFDNATVTCACGNVFSTGSTKQDIRIEICSNCHPFYTGKSKLIDTTGRVERFHKTRAKSVEIAATKTVKKPRKSRTEKVQSK